MRKGAWTNEEDDKLRAYIQRYGHWNWRLLPKFAGLNRCGKSCRLRWMNYLKPGVRRGGYTQEERDLIEKLHQEHGNKWSIMASKLPGRTDHEIKNYWHVHLKDRRLSTSGAKAAGISSSDSISSGTSDIYRRKQKKTKVSSSPEVFVLESSESNSASIPEVAELGSEEIRSNITSTSTRNDDNLLKSSVFGFDDDIWTKPFMVETDSYHGCDFREYEEVGILFAYYHGMWLNDATNML